MSCHLTPTPKIFGEGSAFTSLPCHLHHLSRKFSPRIYPIRPRSLAKLYQKGGLVLLNPKLQNLLSEPIWDMLVSFDKLNDARARANSKSDKPREFTFNHNTYIHIPGTENFTVPGSPTDDEGNPLQTFTPLQIMSTNFEPTKSFRQHITPVGSAEVMFWLGDSARYKILRAVQLHYAKPPISKVTNQYTEFFQFLSEGVEDHWTVQQQYSSCKWAAAQDEALATSMLLHYGWAPRYREKMRGCCIYQMRRADDGIHITFSEPHTYQQRLDAGCARAREVAEGFRVMERNPPFELLFKEACRIFFSFNHFYISISAAYRQTALNKIRAFCEQLTNALRESDKVPFPELLQPDEEDCIPIEYKDDAPVEYVLKWEDFILTSSTVSQAAQRRTNNTNRQITSLLAAWGDDLNIEYNYKQLKERMSDNVISHGKKAGYIVAGHKEGRFQYWKLNLDKINAERS